MEEFERLASHVPPLDSGLGGNYKARHDRGPRW